MYLRPVVGCADEGQKKLGVLQHLPIQNTREGLERPRRIGGSQEDMGRARKDGPFLHTIRLWRQRHYAEPLTQSKVLIEIGLERKLSAQ